MKRTDRLIIFALLLLFGCNESEFCPPLWGDLESGPFRIGIRELIIASASESALVADIWYPAASGATASPLLFRDYVLRLPDFRTKSDAASLQAWLSTAVSGEAGLVGPDTLAEILNAEMLAMLDVEPAPGQFPLVVWTLRHETVVAQSVLNEYLASHGYIVAAPRYTDGTMPLPWELQNQEQRTQAFTDLLVDQASALNALEVVPGVDSSSIGIMTWSYAAELASQVQTQRPNVLAVIGLSSNPLSDVGVYQGALAGGILDSDRLTASYILLTELEGPDGQERTAPPIMTDIGSPSWFVVFNGLTHGNFNTLEGMIPGVFGISTVQPWSKSGTVARIGYEAVARSTRSYLDLYLRSPGAAARIGPSSTAPLPEGFVTVTRFGAH